MKQQKQLDNETRRYIKWVAIGFAIFTMACGAGWEVEYHEDDPSYFLLVEKETGTLPAEGGSDFIYITTNYSDVRVNTTYNSEYRLLETVLNLEKPNQPLPPNHKHEVHFYWLSVSKAQNESKEDLSIPVEVMATRPSTEEEKKKYSGTHVVMGVKKRLTFIQEGAESLEALTGSEQTQEYRQRLENK